MASTISFILDNQIHELDFSKTKEYNPTTTVLNYLRSLPNHKGVKEGCAEGDCGACTVVLGELVEGSHIHYRAVNSCLLFLPKLHGQWLITVENLKSAGHLHPVQQALVDFHGSQCGFCTPGVVLSLLALYKSAQPISREVIEDFLTGNLCRCTGYQPIIEAAEHTLSRRGPDQFSELEEKIISLLKTIPKESIFIKTPKQKYFIPQTIEVLLELKKKHRQARLINGATDMALKVTKGHELLKEIIDIAGVDELRTIKETAHHVFFGSAVNINALLENSAQWFPAIREMCLLFGSRQIREMATVGGNIGTASPVGDLLPVLAAYGAEIKTVSFKAERSIPIDEFIQGYRKTALQADEIIKGVSIPKLKNGQVVKSFKVSKRKDLDISTVSAAFKLELDDSKQIRDIKIIFGGMAEMTKHAHKTEQFLAGRQWSRATVEQAMPLLEEEFRPISDARSGAEFRTIAAKNLLLKFYNEFLNI